MQIEQTAPASSSQTITISAPVETVWGLLADIEHWPDWNPDVKSAVLQGRLQSGTAFIWKTSFGAITSQLQAVEPSRLIGWTGRTMGINAVHVWRLERRDGATVATSEESWSGLLPRLLTWYSQKMLKRSTLLALSRLKSAAEALAK